MVWALQKRKHWPQILGCPSALIEVSCAPHPEPILSGAAPAGGCKRCQTGRLGMAFNIALLRMTELALENFAVHRVMGILDGKRHRNVCDAAGECQTLLMNDIS